MKRYLRDFNYVLFFAMAVLIALGTFSIASAGLAREAIFHKLWIDNLATAAFGLIVYFAIAKMDYREIVGYFSPAAYAVALVFLVAVLAIGGSVYGGKRWLWFFQPSEVAKLATIIFLAKILPALEGFRGFAIASAVIGVPALLILAEPDLGTTLALVPAVTVMMLAAGLWRRALLALIAAGLFAAALVAGLVYEAEKPGQTPERREKIERYLPLRPHQVKRVKIFWFPESDPSGSGYNLRQAQIAIASGGFRGRGWRKGETNKLKYLPQSVSMNDFIFCVYAEEFGFLGSLGLLAAYAALIVSGYWTAFRARDLEGRLVALGIPTLVFAHVFVNIGMSLGIVPITGLPLPFISSGRTFLVVLLAGFGFVQSVNLHREELK